MTYPLRCVVLRSAKLLDHLIEPAVHVIGACAVLLLELRERLLESRHLAISGRLVPVLALPQALLERSLLAPLEYSMRSSSLDRTFLKPSRESGTVLVRFLAGRTG